MGGVTVGGAPQQGASGQSPQPHLQALCVLKFSPRPISAGEGGGGCTRCRCPQCRLTPFLVGGRKQASGSRRPINLNMLGCRQHSPRRVRRQAEFPAREIGRVRQFARFKARSGKLRISDCGFWNELPGTPDPDSIFARRFHPSTPPDQRFNQRAFAAVAEQSGATLETTRSAGSSVSRRKHRRAGLSWPKAINCQQSAVSNRLTTQRK